MVGQSIHPRAQLPRFKPPRIVQRLGDLQPEQVQDVDVLALVLPPRPEPGLWARIPGGAELKRLITAARSPKNTDLLSASADGMRIFAIRSPSDATAFARLTAARTLIKRVLEHQPARIALACPGLTAAAAAAHLESLLAATLAADFALPTFRSAETPRRHLRQIVLVGHDKRLDVSRTRATAYGNNLARWLTVLPGNVLTPGAYRDLLAALAKQHTLTFEYLDRRALRRRKAGAFLAIAADSDDAGIAHLRYAPRGASSRPRLALVGKGICFDTGGVNLKPFKSMLDMHTDMQGSAVAVGLLIALKLLRAPFAVDCWLALSENLIGPRAYKPQDLVVAANGKTIQVVHSDAEGRMALADTLALAARQKPALIIDFATLTGACETALTHRYSGVFCNRGALTDQLVAAGKESGERVWPFPMDEDFDQMLESDFADLKQCPVESAGDHILGARFLSHFVPAEQAWIHVDLSAGSAKGGLAHIPSDTTGFGIRWATELLLNRGLLRTAAEL